jgi:hypothetical protein
VVRTLKNLAAVAVERAGTRVPEFTDILRGVAELAVALKNGFDSGDYERIIVVVRLDERLTPLMAGSVPQRSPYFL